MQNKQINYWDWLQRAANFGSLLNAINMAYHGTFDDLLIHIYQSLTNI